MLSRERLILREVNGSAAETALECQRIVFEGLDVERVPVIYSVLNKSSKRAMKKTGVQNRNEILSHPKIEKGHVLEKHVLYIISKTD